MIEGAWCFVRDRLLLRTLGAVAALAVGLLGLNDTTHEQPTTSVAAETVTSDVANLAVETFPKAVQRTSTFHLDRPPGGDAWELHRCSQDTASARHRNGILVFDAPEDNCVAYYLFAPNGIWNRWASNDRGWVVEASVRVDPRSTGSCPATTGANLWMQDDVHLLQVGISAQAVCLFYPEHVTVPRNTTVGFHNYRVEALGRTVRVYVDGRLAIDHDLTLRLRGTRALAFGDNNGASDPGSSGSQRSYWDYVAYDTTPNFNPARWVGSDWPSTSR